MVWLMTPSLLSLTAIIIAGLSLTGAVAAWWNLRSLNKLRDTFFAGGSAGSMEDVINSLAASLHSLQQQEIALEQAHNKLKHDFNFAIQKVGVIRFNPFADGGGNFSFTIALLDGTDSGIVLTSMHGREQNRIYTKRVKDGRSDSQLTEEELQAVHQAMDTHSNNINSKIKSA